MRIAVWHSLAHGGAKRALFGHLQALKEAGHFIEIWTTDLNSDTHLNFEEFGKVHVVKVVQGTINFNGGYKNPQSIFETKNIITGLKLVQKITADEINASGFDLAFVNSCSVTYMPFISEFLKIPSVLYLGEPFRWLYEANPENVWQAPMYKFYQLRSRVHDFNVNYSKRIQVREEIRAARRYSKILVNSFYSKESVLRAYGIEPEICKLGVDATLFSAAAKSDKDDFVVGVGFLYPPKGADRAINLLSNLGNDIRPKLYWICNGVDNEYLKHIKRYAEEKKVVFEELINIPDNKLVEYMSRARFMIYTPRLEPLGLAPLEANASGTFVIGIAEAGVRETITHQQNGFLIDSVDDMRFIEYAETLLTNKETSIKLGLQARDFVINNWNLTQLKNNIRNAIHSVIK